MDHIKHEEAIILNVLSATVDFPTCESIRMSRSVDPTGQRTLAVVTKCDRASPKDLLEKVTSDEPGIGLGYICVRNRIDDETFDEARIREANLFRSDPFLSTLDKSMAGTPALAQRLVQIQAAMVSKCLPGLIGRMLETINVPALERDKLQQVLPGISDATITFMQIVGCLRKTLRRGLVRAEVVGGGQQMYSDCRLAEMLDEFSKELRTRPVDSKGFLVEELKALDQVIDEIWFPRLPPHSAFLSMVQGKVGDISDLLTSFVNKVWGHIEEVCAKVVADHCVDRPELLSFMRNAAVNAVAKMKKEFAERVDEMIEMENTTAYTCDSGFVDSWDEVIAANRDLISKAMASRTEHVTLEEYGTVNVGHLFSVPERRRDAAFYLKMRTTVYWKVVVRRMVDWFAVQLQPSIQKLVKDEIVSELMSYRGGVEKLFN